MAFPHPLHPLHLPRRLVTAKSRLWRDEDGSPADEDGSLLNRAFALWNMVIGQFASDYAVGFFPVTALSPLHSAPPVAAKLSQRLNEDGPVAS